ncbi:MAG: hypothetical protein HYX68_14945 [Planctomycetes bacterium]|nr:hypothetical protein [Planctomycetota bacterium]
MFTAKSVRVRIAYACLLLLAAGAWIGSGSSDSSLARAQEPKDGKIKELLKERLEVLKDVVKATKAAYLGGKVSFVELAQANARLNAAELELCTTDKERLAVLEAAVAIAKEYETAAVRQFKAGQATHASALYATANRLEAEIALERAKVKMNAKPK